MKRGFTLIELLVVIAIIAILAAILFPVFAQAKVAAKKTTSTSNQKQIALAVIMYAGDYDDMLPRQDGCQLNSSLNGRFNNQPSGTNPLPWCDGTNGFTFRMNHFSWQKWVMPYIKNLDLFIHAGRGRNDAVTPSCPGGQWSQCAQITGSYALNLSLFGALNTYDAITRNNPNLANQFRNSWLGGSLGNIPRVAETAMIMETGNPAIAFAPTSPIQGDTGISQTNYPPAIREIWVRELFNWTNCSGWNNALNEVTSTPNEQRVFGGGWAVAFADGHVKYMSAGAIAAATPTAAEYGANPMSNFCGFTGGTMRISNVPNTNINYPFWGLGN